MNSKAVVLLSGGLDSTLALQLILDQGVEVTALNFGSPFCTCTPKSAGCMNQAAAVAGELGVPVRVMHKGMEYLDVVKNPKYGYGRAMNPCVDCRIFMYKKAKKFMEETDASFIVTGEVLGQRKKSQKKHLMEIIERESGLEGLIVRPLTANNLPPSIPEKNNLLDRTKFLSIQGRSRKEQFDLLGKYKIRGAFCPSGGCLLTDPNIARKLKDLFKNQDDLSMRDLKLLRISRHFRINEDAKIILGKNENENDVLNNLQKEEDIFVNPANFKGPDALIPEGRKNRRNFVSEASQLVIGYSKAEQDVYILNVNNNKQVKINYNSELFQSLKSTKL